ncbi:hypothetical protein COCOBI_04-2890 [Coccomyxa sp. Obi]|nr:hypothetical protein COCOBI_04-2890 [Coccomyxa sp. Obi]
MWAPCCATVIVTPASLAWCPCPSHPPAQAPHPTSTHPSTSSPAQVQRTVVMGCGQVAAAADGEQPKGPATPKEGTRVKPFYEAPQFVQMDARAQPRAGAAATAAPCVQLPHPHEPSRLVQKTGTYLFAS